jgi:hypothetical protein
VCALTLGPGGTSVDPPGVNTVTATFVAVPPPEPRLELAPPTLDLRSSNDVALTVVDGTGAESWTASAAVDWLDVTSGGSFAGDGSAHVTVSYSGGSQARAPNGTTGAAVTVALFASDGHLVQTVPVAVTSDGAPVLSGARCEASAGSQNWDITLQADDFPGQSIQVTAEFSPVGASPARASQALPRSGASSTWSGLVFLGGEYSVTFTVVDETSGTTSLDPPVLSCGAAP